MCCSLEITLQSKRCEVDGNQEEDLRRQKICKYFWKYANFLGREQIFLEPLFEDY